MRVGLVKDACEKDISCWQIELLEVQCICNIRMWCEEKDGCVPMRYIYIYIGDGGVGVSGGVSGCWWCRLV